MKTLLKLLVLMLGLSGLIANADTHAPISFVVPGQGGGKPDQPPVVVVVDGGFVSHEGHAIPANEVVSYINSTLKSQQSSTLAVHIRQGIKFGEVVRALDELRKTEAKAIGVSMVELAPNQTP